MAEAWLEEEEEELRRDRRDCAATRRGRRGQNRNSAGHSERNKPEQRSSSQGRLSSIRAAIKRTSTRAPSQSDLQRERRRPEITVIAAEPLGPAPWFPGNPGNCSASAALAFPSRPPQAHWRISEPASSELPPSYDQVIREIGREPVTTRISNVSPGRSTTTIATQTDFEVPGKRSVVENGVSSKLNLIDADLISLKNLPEPLSPNSPGPPLINGPVVVSIQSSYVQTQNQENDILKYPVPKPRTKVPSQETRDQIQHKFESIATCETRPISTQTTLKEISGAQVIVEEMSSDSNQNSILSRIQAFEAQNSVESSAAGSQKRPEVLPRSLSAKPGISAAKPTLGPKPSVANRISGEWNSGIEGKSKGATREGPPLLPKSQAVGSFDGSRLEPPKKPKPVLLSSISNGSSDTAGETSTENSVNGERKFPVPAPRPTLPKKSLSMDSKVVTPLIPAPRQSIPARTKAFTAAEEGPYTSQQPVQPVKPVSGSEPDLICFDDDDDIFFSSARPVSMSSSAGTFVDPFQTLPRSEPTPPELPSRPPPVRKPTVIRIPSQQSKSSSDDVQIPPPLPAEKPVGSFLRFGSRKTSLSDKAANSNSKHSEWGGATTAQPVLPPRPPGGGKAAPGRPPPLKTAPGRPPPPKTSSSQGGAFKRSSSDVGLSNKTVPAFPKSKSQGFRKKGAEIPPRPGPGHSLYNKYTLPLPHGIAERDFVSRVPGELSFKRGDVLVLLQRTNKDHFQCQKGDEVGSVQASYLKIITPLNEEDSFVNKSQSFSYHQKDGDSNNVPRAIVMYDFVAEHNDDLALKTGDTVFLVEKIDKEWYRGKCKNNTGIFPADFVKVIVDVSDADSGKRMPQTPPSSSTCTSGPRCMARFDFEGEQQDELSFSEGDVIQLKEYIGDEWAKGELKGQVGMFPINFVEVIEDLPPTGPPVSQSKTLSSGFSGTSFSKKDSSQISQGDRSSGQWCEALYDFTGETHEDLSFKQGDVIQLLEHLDSEWYRGKLEGEEGTFPAAFVQLISGPSGGTQTQTKVGRKTRAKALFDFNAENEDELSFKAGDFITSVEVIDAEWMSGEVRNKSGIFPSNCVQVIQEPWS
ncbi:SH3 domain-containing protein 19 isoform X2 [Protopterus annectens]|uniref:SH3 domain-containing protein 19 isoform X2 n=1 Tax=Protopterus annectens TaxID=7888 RepID=UPI001CFBDAFD|nr:SH3 domain-containing protein 19 isoform X2 [Protopterus annectens]